MIYISLYDFIRYHTQPPPHHHNHHLTHTYAYTHTYTHTHTHIRTRQKTWQKAYNHTHHKKAKVNARFCSLSRACARTHTTHPFFRSFLYGLTQSEDTIQLFYAIIRAEDFRKVIPKNIFVKKYLIKTIYNFFDYFQKSKSNSNVFTFY